MRSRYLGITLVALLVLSVSGCSFLFVQGPPDVPQDDYGSLSYFTCTEDNAWPILDAIWAGFNGLGAALAVTGNGSTGLIEYPEQAAGWGFAWLVVSGFSSYVGFQGTAACRRARMIWASENNRRGGSGSVIDLRSRLLPETPPGPVFEL